MSADNYYIIRRHEAGFTPVMGFMSDEVEPTPRAGAKVYATPEDALAAIANEYTEYGSSIHPECGEVSITAYAQQLSGDHLGMWSDTTPRHQVTHVNHGVQTVEVKTTYGVASYRPSDVLTLFWSEK